jgi:hypothetical protein
MNKCIVENCEKMSKGKYCIMHAARIKRHGSPLVKKHRSDGFDCIKAFFSKIIPIPECGCWIWEGGCSSGGYGMATYYKKRDLAQRISWIIHNGPIPQGMNVLHRCDTPPCVNPHHLFLGTDMDNVLDKINKFRQRYHTKISKLDAQNIKHDTRKARIIAVEYGIARSTVSCIKAGIIWKSIK